ncbi:MAG: isoprenylcysteine carboxyl methyltransferase family protein [Synechococcus sp.]
MSTQVLFTGIVVAVIGQRLVEMGISQRHLSKLLSQRAREHGDNWLPAVKLLQTSWWIAMLAEVWVLDRPFIPALGAIAFVLLLAGQLLRYLSMRALKDRWTLTITTIPNSSAVNTGIYRYLRHPNWLGVILEIAALPLIHTAYLTAIIFTLANAWLMSQRIPAEERALRADTNYATALGDRPCLMPRLGWFSLSVSSES